MIPLDVLRAAAGALRAHRRRTLLSLLGVAIGVACVLVFTCLWIGLGSARLTALSLAPNLAPLVAAFAAMGVLRMPIDAGTVMVASVALGIAVDNTAHVLESARRLRAAGAVVVDGEGRPAVFGAEPLPATYMPQASSSATT